MRYILGFICGALVSLAMLDIKDQRYVVESRSFLCRVDYVTPSYDAIDSECAGKEIRFSGASLARLDLSPQVLYTIGPGDILSCRRAYRAGGLGIPRPFSERYQKCHLKQKWPSRRVGPGHVPGAVFYRTSHPLALTAV